MVVLTETVSALQQLRKLGWVHRDVSVGNILLCEGVAKLEYAKKIGDVKSHEMRTANESSTTLSGKSSIASRQGTMHFMSIEVAAQKYLFPPSCPEPSATEIKQRISGMIPNPTHWVPFSHNHLHDLESLWWVAVWMAFYNYFSKPCYWMTIPCSYLLKDVHAYLKQAQNLFPSVLTSTHRLIGFQTTFSGSYAVLPNNKKAIGVLLDGLREILIAHYRAIEAGLPKSVDSNSSSNVIYESFKYIFSTFACDDLVLVFIPEIYTKLRKRPRSESTNDTGVAKKTLRLMGCSLHLYSKTIMTVR